MLMQGVNGSIDRLLEEWSFLSDKDKKRRRSNEIFEGIHQKNS